MPVTRERSPARSSFQFDWPGTVIAILLGIFFALHVLAGALLQDRTQAVATPAREATRTSLYE
jgi:hypothetical protein